MGTGQKESPTVHWGQGNHLVFSRIRRPVDQTKIHQALFQHFPYCFSVSAADMEPELGMELGKLVGHLGYLPDYVGFSGTHVNVPGNLRRGVDLRTGLLEQLQDLFRPFPEQLAFRGQAQMPLSPDQQGTA